MSRPTPTTIRKAAEAAFCRNNPDATDATFEWTFGPVLAPWADGSTCWNGTATVKADGYRCSRIFATAERDGSGLTVRVRSGRGR